MNAISKALYEIHEEIPIEVLDFAFKERNPKLNKVISLDEKITNQVIRSRVIVDANLVGGILIRVDLNKCAITALSNTEYVVEVPKALTEGRSIVSVLSLVSNVIYQQPIVASDMQAPLSSSVNMMNNLGVENIVQTSRLEIVGDNIVLIQDPMIHLINGVLKCNIENSPNMENLHPRVYNVFAEACILATKARIYRERVKLDQGAIYGGHELGVIKDTIMEYSDANQMYKEFVNTKLRKVLYMNNSDSKSRLIKAMMGNNL